MSLKLSFTALAVFGLFLSVSCQKDVCEDKEVEPLEFRELPTLTVKSDPGRASSLWTAVYNSEDGFDTTQYFDFIIEVSEAGGWAESDIRWTIDKFASVQVQDGEQTGRVPRYLKDGAQDYSDANNIEFALQLASVALIRYYPTWSDETKAAFDGFVDKAVNALWKHDNVAVTYSNIYLMHIWNLVALGENLDPSRRWGAGLDLTPAAIAAKGYECLDAYYAQTAAYGFHEHNSPTYTGVQMECIGFICNFMKNASALAKATKIRDLYSVMMAANYYTPASTLSGAMSRCYYRGASGGNIDQMAKGMLSGTGMYAYKQLAAWTLSAKNKRINAEYPRMVSYIFGDETATYNDGKQYYAMNSMNYVDKYYCVSSGGHHYTGNGTEKQINIIVRTDNHPYNVNIAHYMEGRGDPYGFLPGTYSHVWTCYRDAFARAQHDNQIVFLEAGNGRDNPNATNLMSHFLIPKTNVDELWVDDTQVTDWGSEPSGDCFFIKIDDVVVSIRFLYGFDKNGASVTHTLYDDSGTGTRNYYVLNNGTHTAARISTMLNENTPVAGDAPAGVAVWLRTDDCIITPSRFAKLRKQVMEASVSVPAQKAFANGDSFACYVDTPEGIRLGISGTFGRKHYYNRYIYNDTAPEYLEASNWYFAQNEAWGNSTDFSNFCEAFFSINGWDEAKYIFK